MSTRSTRSERLNLRVSTDQLEKIRKAAQATDTSVTEFVLSHTQQAAEQVLADLRWFNLDDETWLEFQTTLDRPAVAKPRLTALLDQPDQFTDPE